VERRTYLESPVPTIFSQYDVDLIRWLRRSFAGAKPFAAPMKTYRWSFESAAISQLMWQTAVNSQFKRFETHVLQAASLR
jgi:hypothetical protein